MRKELKAVIFARVSSKAQEDEGYSLDSQLKLLRAYCKKKGLTVVKEFKIAETASKAQRRTEFRAMLNYLASNRIPHLAVEKTDRAARNIKDAAEIYDWIEGDERRVFHSVKEGLELHKWSNSQVKFMWGIFVTFAKQYTDSLREEAMKGWDEKLAQGWLPAVPPPGYKTVVEYSKKIHVLEPDVSPLIEQVFNLAKLPDYTVIRITEVLKDMGVTTRKGRPYAKSYVHKMLTNPFYIGINRFNGKEYPGAQEPLISKELFYQVQEKLHKPSYGRNHKHNPIFKGMIRCSDCNSSITWQLQKGRYYGACQRYDSACKGRSMLREDRVEASIVNSLAAIKDRGGKKLAQLRHVLNLDQLDGVGAHRNQVIKALNKQLERLQIMENSLYEDKLAGSISKAKYEEKYEDLADQSERIVKRLVKLNKAQASPHIDEAAIKKDQNRIIELYLNSTPSQKRTILSELPLSLRLVQGRLLIE